MAEPLLARVAVLSGTEEDGASLGAYWVKVMHLFEQIPSTQWFVSVANVAVHMVPAQHPTAVSERDVHLVAFSLTYALLVFFL